MSQIIGVSEVRSYVCEHLQSVFSTMLSLQADVLPDSLAHTVEGDRVTGTVGLAGNSINGLVYLHLPVPLAVQAAGAMIGLSPEDLGEPEVNDVIGEVTNMVAGGLKSWMCDSGASCALTTPAVIRGKSFTVMPKAGVEQLFVPFKCQGSSALIEVHLRFN